MWDYIRLSMTKLCRSIHWLDSAPLLMLEPLKVTHKFIQIQFFTLFFIKISSFFPFYASCIFPQTFFFVISFFSGMNLSNRVKFSGKKRNLTVQHHFRSFSLNFVLLNKPQLRGELFLQLQNNTQKILSRILQLTVVRFLQFAGSKATEHELMECCIVAHLTHVHQRRFLRIHGISLSLKTKTLSRIFFAYTNIPSYFSAFCYSLSLSGCGLSLFSLPW